MYGYAVLISYITCLIKCTIKNTYGKCIYQTIEEIVFGIYSRRVMFEELIQKQFQIELKILLKTRNLYQCYNMICTSQYVSIKKSCTQKKEKNSQALTLNVKY